MNRLVGNRVVDPLLDRFGQLHLGSGETPLRGGTIPGTEGGHDARRVCPGILHLGLDLRLEIVADGAAHRTTPGKTLADVCLPRPKTAIDVITDGIATAIGAIEDPVPE